YWPYLGLFAALLLTGIGLPPLPEEVTVAAAGIAAAHGELVWWLAWPVCVAGGLAADLVLYALGRVGGQAVFRLRRVNRTLAPGRRAKLEARLRRHGWKILIAGRLVPGSRTGVFVLAGALRYPFASFLLIDGVAAAISVGIVFFGTGLLTGWLTPMLG